MIYSDDRTSSGLRVIQLTDIHLFATSDQSLMGITTRASLLPIVQQVAEIQPAPDLLLLTGDLSQDGSPASYRQIIELLNPLNLPIYWLPGNHDCFEVMERSLIAPSFRADKHFSQEGWRFLLLDSQIPGAVPGRLSAETLDRLQRELAAYPSQPTLIAFHHPPLSLNTQWLDFSALQNPEELFQVVDRHPQVKLVLFGHIHQEVEQMRSGVTYLGCPSTCFQFARDHQQFTLDVDQYPGFRILDLAADGSWTTEVRRVDCQMKAIATPKGY